MADVMERCVHAYSYFQTLDWSYQEYWILIVNTNKLNLIEISGPASMAGLSVGAVAHRRQVQSCTGRGEPMSFCPVQAGSKGAYLKAGDNSVTILSPCYQ